MAKLKNVKSINELHVLALKDPRYNKLAILAAGNLGHQPRNLSDAINLLKIEALESDEEGIVGEINFCIDMV